MQAVLSVLKKVVDPVVHRKFNSIIGLRDSRESVGKMHELLFEIPNSRLSCNGFCNGDDDFFLGSEGGDSDGSSIKLSCVASRSTSQRQFGTST